MVGFELNYIIGHICQSTTSMSYIHAVTLSCVLALTLEVLPWELTLFYATVDCLLSITKRRFKTHKEATVRWAVLRMGFAISFMFFFANPIGCLLALAALSFSSAQLLATSLQLKREVSGLMSTEWDCALMSPT